ncbi:MAG: hypothetical protein H0U13_00435 [Gemmatimonadaceae bacterium]|nr:hypothetical protein [Gemmatimonadaceae bacterium]
MLIFQQSPHFVKGEDLKRKRWPLIPPGNNASARLYISGTPAGESILSEFYQLRRTNIKDLTGFCGFLVGFLGSAPLAWRYLGAQLEGDDFVRGLWLFFGIVLASAVLAGAAGLGAGFLLGGLWERYHRHRRSRRPRRESAPSGNSSPPVDVTASREAPPSAPDPPDGSRQPPQLRIVRGRRRSGP